MQSKFIKQRLTFFFTISPYIIVTRQPEIENSDPMAWKAALKRKEIPCQFCKKKSLYMKGSRVGTEAEDQSVKETCFFLSLSLSLFFFWKRELIRLRGDILPQEEGLWPEWRVAELNGPGHKCFWERRRSHRKRQREGKIMKGERMRFDWVEGWKGDKADLQSLLQRCDRALSHYVVDSTEQLLTEF